MLKQLREGKGRAILKFQPLLIAVRYDLGRLDAVIAHRERFLIRRTIVKDAGFASAMAGLARQRQRLTEVDGTARCLGDFFAWFFYQYDVALLRKHARRPRSNIMGVGFGGKSEKGLAQWAQVLDGHFVIHHAATSMLRLGDMSVWDCETRRIVGLGEAKSGVPKHGSLEIQVAYTLIPTARFAKAAKGRGTIAPLPFPPAESDRRARQLREMTGAVADSVRPVAKNLSAITDTHARDLADGVKRAREGKSVWINAGPGLLIGCVPSHLRTALAVAENEPSGFVDQVKDLFIAGSTFNSLILGSILYDRDGRPSSELGLRPLFWQHELDTDAISDLVFQRVVAVSIFNPAHLLEALALDGFTITLSRPPLDFKIEKLIAGRRLTLGAFDYWARMRTYGLYHHESVLELIRTSLRAAESAGDGKTPVSVDLQIVEALIPPVSR